MRGTSPASVVAASTASGLRATLFHQGAPLGSTATAEGRTAAASADLSPAQFGIGPVTSAAIWAELGGVRRFANSDDVVRHTGLDITVHSSGTRRAAGHLWRQGPQLLRWALYEAAKCASRRASPDHEYYTALRDRRTAGLATLAVARKIARRCHHTLRELGDQALQPAA